MDGKLREGAQTPGSKEMLTSRNNSASMLSLISKLDVVLDDDVPLGDLMWMVGVLFSCGNRCGSSRSAVLSREGMNTLSCKSKHKIAMQSVSDRKRNFFRPLNRAPKKCNLESLKIYHLGKSPEFCELKPGREMVCSYPFNTKINFPIFFTSLDAQKHHRFDTHKVAPTSFGLSLWGITCPSTSFLKSFLCRSFSSLG